MEKFAGHWRGFDLRFEGETTFVYLSTVRIEVAPANDIIPRPL
jgi:hypothetical protein